MPPCTPPPLSPTPIIVYMDIQKPLPLMHCANNAVAVFSTPNSSHVTACGDLKLGSVKHPVDFSFHIRTSGYTFDSTPILYTDGLVSNKSPIGLTTPNDQL